MWYYMLEVVTAILLLTGMLFLTFGKEERIVTESILIKQKIFSGLEALDNQGKLRGYVLANNTAPIKDFLSRLLPGRGLEVKVCHQLEQCQIELPYEEVITVNYFIAGDYGRFNQSVVIVSSWSE